MARFSSSLIILDKIFGWISVFSFTFNIYFSMICRIHPQLQFENDASNGKFGDEFFVSTTSLLNTPNFRIMRPAVMFLAVHNSSIGDLVTD